MTTNSTTVVQATVKEINQFVEHFKQNVEPNESEQPQWLFNLRRHALEQFVDTGFPDQTEEDWRFTNISPLAKLRYKYPLKPAAEDLPSDILNNLPLIKIPANLLVFVNGYFINELSNIIEQPANGGYIGSLENFIARDSDVLKTIFDAPGAELNDAFSALNSALFKDGALIYIPRGTRLSHPIHIANILFAKESAIVASPHHIITVGERSSATIYETYSSYYPDTTAFTNAFTRIYAGEDSVVEQIRCQIENTGSFNIGSTITRISARANFSSHSIALGSKISRHTIKSKLNGEGIESIFNGVYVATDSQLNDHHLVVEHLKPRCASHEYFNGILSDKARGVFHGKIYVYPDAIKTDAKQTNKNLLLSDNAIVNSKPQLEIYADDVKCTHGATVGRLDENAIFYLRSRAIPAHKARQMLIYAFASENLEFIKDIVARNEIEQILNNWLQNHLVNL